MSNEKNNKVLIVLFLLSFFVKGVYSQTYYSNKESSTFSFTLGLTSTGLYNDTISYQQGILFNGGFVYTHIITDKTNIGVELLYSGMAVKSSSPIIKYRFGYIDIPVYFQYKFSDNFLANIGIQYSKYMSSKYYYLDGSHAGGVHPEPLATKMGDDVAVLAGIELGLSKNLFIAGRYTLSTNPFFDKASPYFGVFQLSFRYVVFRGFQQSDKKPSTSALF
jgi:hypothetical protein